MSALLPHLWREKEGEEGVGRGKGRRESTATSIVLKTFTNKV